jgi:hypothetical protein
VIFQVVQAQPAAVLLVQLLLVVQALLLERILEQLLVELPQELLERQGLLELPRVQPVPPRVELQRDASSFRKDHLLLVMQLRWLGLA